MMILKHAFFGIGKAAAILIEHSGDDMPIFGIIDIAQAVYHRHGSYLQVANSRGINPQP